MEHIQELKKYEVVFKKTVFLDVESGVSLFVVSSFDGSCIKKVYGKFPISQHNLPLQVVGRMINHDKYGEIIEAVDIQIIPGDLERSVNLLMSLGVDGMNSRMARRIITACDENNIIRAAFKDYIDDILYDATDVGLGYISDTTSKIRELVTQLQVTMFIGKFGGTTNDARRIISNHAEDAMTIIRTNPYQLVREDLRLSFSVMDAIGKRLGFEANSDFRVAAILSRAIGDLKKKGSCFWTMRDIKAGAARYDKELSVEELTPHIEKHKEIIRVADKEQNSYFYDAEILKDEQRAAKEFARVVLGAKTIPWNEALIDEIESRAGFTLGRQQREAFQLLQSTGVKILTGDPGTGKTTTLNLLLQYAETTMGSILGRKAKIALAAPSGRAAQRMKETTGRNAQTVHKLIDYIPYAKGALYKDASDMIDADIIVIDEVSMLGVSTFAKLFGAIRTGTLVFLIGDTNQLPSVEAGAVLRDLIKSNLIYRCHLSEVHRQKEDSLININAKHIINGENLLKTGKDFKLLYSADEKTTVSIATEVVQKYLGLVDKNSIQVLAPKKGGTFGTQEGNKALQKLFNPDGKDGIKFGANRYAVGDRVILKANNYALNYCNGDIGYIRKISSSGMVISINEEDIALPVDRYGDLDLAYACTIHKSQGSEYEHVVLVLQKDAKGMLDRNLFYTAVTRAKKTMVVIYEDTSVEHAIRTYRLEDRKTLLAERARYEYVVQKKLLDSQQNIC